MLGGVIAIGVAYGRAKYEAGEIGMEQVELLESVIRARRLCHRFKEKFGGLRCSEVQVWAGFNTEVGAAQFTPEIFKDHAKYGDVTGPAARLAAEIILEPEDGWFWERNRLTLQSTFLPMRRSYFSMT